MKKTEYKIIYRFRFKNGRLQKTSYEDIVTEPELDYIKSQKNVCICSKEKIEE